MERIKLGQGLELEHTGEGEYVLRIRTPKIKVPTDLTGGHLKQAKKEVLLAARSLIDRAIKGEEEKSEE